MFPTLFLFFGPNFLLISLVSFKKIIFINIDHFPQVLNRHFVMYRILIEHTVLIYQK